MHTYADPVTKFEVKVLTTTSPHTKPYFDTETTTPDDTRAFATSSDDDGRKLWVIDVATGQRDLLIELGSGDRFSAPLSVPHGWVFRGKSKEIQRVDLTTGTTETVADAPFCRSATSGHTDFADGTIVASYQHDRAYWILAVTDPKSGKSEIVYRTDYWTNHAQACPGDSESVLHVHETGGDALQRMWMFNTRERIVRPYFIEKLDDWVTHECWTRSGNQVMFCKMNHPVKPGDNLDEIWYGARDGQSFRCVGKGHYHHGAPDVTERWIIADCSRDGTITLLDTETGENHLLVTGLRPRGGNEHAHPSFNRRGDTVFFSLPREGEIIQVAALDLNQVSAWAAKE